MVDNQKIFEYLEKNLKICIEKHKGFLGDTIHVKLILEDTVIDKDEIYFTEGKDESPY